MNNIIIRNIIRFIGLLLIQTLILNRIDLSMGEFDYLKIIIYPIFILLLPINMPRWMVILISFIFGLFIDIFSNTPGVHASASVFTAYVRKYILQFLEPQGGYNINEIPSLRFFDISWILIYSSILLFLHLLWYFTMESFSYVFFIDIILNSIFSFIISIVIILIIQFILRPKY